MNADEFEAQHRRREWFHGLRVPDGMWAVVRVDGRSFSRFTETQGYERPFDPAFSRTMRAAMTALIEEFDGIFAFTESDEISVAFRPHWDLFDRSVEKLVSLTAACAAGVVSVDAGVPVQFDSRVWIGADVGDVVDYFSWRQADAARCALNGWCYWTLRREGLSARAATSRLKGTTVAERNDLLHERGINFNDTPLWQRRGLAAMWETYPKDGHNPVTGEAVTVNRRRVAVNQMLPMKDGYRDLVADALRWGDL